MSAQREPVEPCGLCVQASCSARIRTTANDIVKICALSDRRQLADVPRVSRAGPHDRRRTASQRARHADQRRVHLRHDAPQAPQRAQAGAHRGVLRFAGPHLPRRPRRRLQSQPRADAGRARRADPHGARRVRGAGRAHPHVRALRSGRCDRDAGGESGGGRLRGGDRHGRQGFLSARPRPHPRLQSEGGRHVVRRGGRQREVRRRARSRRGRAGADGRHDRQHQGCAGHRRKGGARADRHLRIARKSPRARIGGEAQALSRRPSRECRAGAPEPRARAHPHRCTGGARPRGIAVPRRVARAHFPDLQRARFPDARQGVRAHSRHHHQNLPRRQDGGGCAASGGPAAGRRTVRAPRPAGSPDRHARVDCRPGILDRAARGRLCPGGAPGARGHSQHAARRGASGASPAARRRDHPESGPRSEVRRDRAGPPRRDAARARHRHDAGELSGGRDALRAPSRRSRARADELQGADRRGRLRPRRQGGVARRPAGRGRRRLRGRARRSGRSARADLPRAAREGAVERGLRNARAAARWPGSL